MSKIKDSFFGGAEKKAGKARVAGFKEGQKFIKAGTAEAQAALNRLFPEAQQSLQQGFGAARNIFAQSVPAQTQALQAGSVGAQQQLLAGLPLFQQAILGGQIDFSQLQPTQLQPDLSFLQQQDPFAVEPVPVATAAPVQSPLAGTLPFRGISPFQRFS